MSEGYILEVENISKSFHNQVKLAPISFQVREGEVLALCGGNGAGKSTLLKIIVGMLKPTTGRILLQGETFSSLAIKKRHLFGYFPDQIRYPIHLTAREILCYLARLQDAPLYRVPEVLELVGLTSHQDERVRTFSKGMQQRLGLAQSLLTDPPLLIFDEPTNGLDPIWVHHFKQIVRQLQQNGKTILFTSHILHDVEELADRVALMNEGKLLVLGSLAELRQQDGVLMSWEDLFFHYLQST